MNALLKQEGNNDREIDIDEKTSNKFGLKYRTNLFQIECFITNSSFSETAENNSREVRPRTSATTFVKLPTINIKSFDGEQENWYIFVDSFECAIDKNNTLSETLLKVKPQQ